MTFSALHTERLICSQKIKILKIMIRSIGGAVFLPIPITTDCSNNRSDYAYGWPMYRYIACYPNSHTNPPTQKHHTNPALTFLSTHSRPTHPILPTTVKDDCC